MNVTVYVVRESTTWEFCGVYGTREEAESQRTKCGAEYIEECPIAISAPLLTLTPREAMKIYVVIEGPRDAEFVRFAFTDPAQAERYNGELMRTTDKDCRMTPDEASLDDPAAMRMVARPCWDVQILQPKEGVRVGPIRRCTNVATPEATREVVCDHSPSWANLRSFVSADDVKVFAAEFVQQKFSKAVVS